jgi:hypothetical protein
MPGQTSTHLVRNFRGGAGLVVLTLAGLIVPFGIGALAEWGWVAVHGPGGRYALEVIFEAIFWSGLFSTCLFVSRRYGSGTLRWDYQIRFRPVDVPIAIGGALQLACWPGSW